MIEGVVPSYAEMVYVYRKSTRTMQKHKFCVFKFNVYTSKWRNLNFQITAQDITGTHVLVVVIRTWSKFIPVTQNYMNYILRTLQHSINIAAFYTLFKINVQNVWLHAEKNQGFIRSFSLIVISYRQLSDLLECINPQ